MAELIHGSGAVWERAAETLVRKAPPRDTDLCVSQRAAMAEGAAAAAPARPATLPPELVGDAGLRLNNTW